jgi:type I restriction enzyme R subunit
MNEADTRANLIDPKLMASGWGVVEGSRIQREFPITAGRILVGGKRAAPLKADYVLTYKNRKLAAVEAKSDEQEVGEGVAQAKNYAHKLQLEYTYSANGKEVYQIEMSSGKEGNIAAFPTPDQLWEKIFSDQNDWKDKFDAVPFESVGGTKSVRYYQDRAITCTMDAIAEKRQRILLTLATGTGKTFIAFQIAWKLFQTRWNLKRDGSRRPRILFLADRNILANQAFNGFGAFPEDALVRISPKEISKKGGVPTNGSIFFTIFQTFMAGEKPSFGQYPPDYFDLVIVDECHRGGANDEGNWRGILDYFAPAVQIGLTATPKKAENANTYKYFGEPVYVYSLKEGINDGFLTPYKIKRVQTTIDDYQYVSDDTVLEGEVEEGRVYEEKDFNKIIEIKEREAKRVQVFLAEINQNEKTIVFCASQAHAAVVRDLINQYSESKDPFYCVRVTASDGALGEQYLADFQDNDKTLPTILTTSQKLSTGVDARNVRNIVLMRPVNNIIEFKQIIGRGTRLFDGKDYFTIYDYVDAYHHFKDPQWDGDPIEPEPCAKCGNDPCTCVKQPPKPCAVCGNRPCTCEKPPPPPCPKCGQVPCVCNKKVKIKLAAGKEIQIKHMIATSFMDADGKPMSVAEFIQALYGTLPSFFKSEADLKKTWSDPITRKALLEKLAEAGYGQDELTELQKVVNAEKSDLFDVLEFISYQVAPTTREDRVSHAKPGIFMGLSLAQKDFLEFVLFKYIDSGVEELDQAKLPELIQLKYSSIADATEVLGGVDEIRTLFLGFQKHLYLRPRESRRA